MASEHKCPYGGERPNEGRHALGLVICGMDGWLCCRCREDRADARTRAAVKTIDALRLAMSPLSKKLEPDPWDLIEEIEERETIVPDGKEDY